MRATVASIATVAVALLGTLATARAQGTFEGMVAYKLTGMEGGMRYFQKGDMTRQEMTLEGMPGGTISIYDVKSGDAKILMPQQKKFMRMNMQSFGAQAQQMAGGMGGGGGARGAPPDMSTMKVTATGKSETVAGVECKHYLFEDTKNKAQIDICGAAGMGFMGAPGGGAGGMFSTSSLLKAQNPVLAKLAKEGFFPLKMTVMDAKKNTISWEATDVEKGKLDAALFEVPDDYEEFQMPGMPRRP